MTRAGGRAALTLVLLGAMIRVAAVVLSSPAGAPNLSGGSWPGDHAAYVLWARHAVEQGVQDLYNIPREARVPTLTADGIKSASAGGNAVPNYPPLSLYLIAAEGWLLRQWDAAMTANTVAARAVFALFSVIGDVVLALGVGRLASQVIGPRVRRRAALACWLLPPIWLDSCWWGQTDSWMLAPAVWMLAAMIDRRWLVAGALWGIALALKPQALLLAPVWAMAVFLERCGPDGSSAAGLVKIVAGGLTALGVLVVTAAGFFTHDGWAWLQQSYLRNLADEWPRTTLAAFNVWYVDLLVTLDTDVNATLLGVSCDAWGKVLIVLALAGVAWLAARRGPDRPTRYVMFTALWLLAIVTVATRVHERYVVMCLPMLCVLACRGRRAAAAVAALAVAAGLQMTHHAWLDVGADAWSTKIRPRLVSEYNRVAAALPAGEELPALEEALRGPFERFRAAHRPYAPYEWLLTLAMLGSTAWVTCEVGRREPATEGSPTVDQNRATP